MARFGDGVEFQLVEGGPETDCELSEHHFVGGLSARGGESPFSPADERLFCCPIPAVSGVRKATDPLGAHRVSRGLNERAGTGTVESTVSGLGHRLGEVASSVPCSAEGRPKEASGGVAETWGEEGWEVDPGWPAEDRNTSAIPADPFPTFGAWV